MPEDGFTARSNAIDWRSIRPPHRDRDPNVGGPVFRAAAGVLYAGGNFTFAGGQGSRQGLDP